MAGTRSAVLGQSPRAGEPSWWSLPSWPGSLLSLEVSVLPSVPDLVVGQGPLPAGFPGGPVQGEADLTWPRPVWTRASDSTWGFP